METNKLIMDENESMKNKAFAKGIDDIKQVIGDTIVEFHNNDFPKYINNYKKYLGFVHDRLRTLDEWQSNVDYPMVASVVDTMFGNVFDFGYEFGVNEPVLKNLCTKAFDFRNSGRQTFKDTAKEILITGKGYVKPFLIKEELEEKILDRKLVVKVKMPSMYYVSVFDVMYDRSRGLSKSPYHIVRTYNTGKDIEAKILPSLLSKYKPEQHAEVKRKFKELLKKYKDDIGSRFSMYDYNPVKMLASTTQLINAGSETIFDLPSVSDKKGLLAGFSVDNGTIGNEQKNNYFLNHKDSVYETVEWNDSERKVVFINGNLIWSGPRDSNIMDVQEAEFSRIPGTGNANGVADNLGGLQDINNMLWNSFLDNIKLNLGPMFKVTGNIPIGKNGTLDFRKFRMIRSNGSGDIEKIQLGVNDFAPVNFMQIVESFSQQRSGVSNYIMGGNGSVERVSGGIDMKFNQYKAKLTPITDSIDQMMGNIARSWILMFFKFFTKDELAKKGLEIEEQFDDDNKFETFLVNGKDIRDIIDENSVSFTYNSLDKLTKENSRKTLVEAFPAIAQYMPDKVDMAEMIKVFTGQDFDPQKIVKENKPLPSQSGQWGPQDPSKQWGYDKPYLKGSSPYMPTPKFNPADTGGQMRPEAGPEGFPGGVSNEQAPDEGSDFALEQEIQSLV